MWTEGRGPESVLARIWPVTCARLHWTFCVAIPLGVSHHEHRRYDLKLVCSKARAHAIDHSRCGYHCPSNCGCWLVLGHDQPFRRHQDPPHDQSLALPSLNNRPDGVADVNWEDSAPESVLTKLWTADLSCACFVSSFALSSNKLPILTS